MTHDIGSKKTVVHKLDFYIAFDGARFCLIREVDRSNTPFNILRSLEQLEIWRTKTFKDLAETGNVELRQQICEKFLRDSFMASVDMHLFLASNVSKIKTAEDLSGALDICAQFSRNWPAKELWQKFKALPFQKSVAVFNYALTVADRCNNKSNLESIYLYCLLLSKHGFVLEEANDIDSALCNFFSNIQFLPNNMQDFFVRMVEKEDIRSCKDLENILHFIATLQNLFQYHNLDSSFKFSQFDTLLKYTESMIEKFDGKMQVTYLFHWVFNLAKKCLEPTKDAVNKALENFLEKIDCVCDEQYKFFTHLAIFDRISSESNLEFVLNFLMASDVDFNKANQWLNMYRVHVDDTLEALLTQIEDYSRAPLRAISAFEEPTTTLTTVHALDLSQVSIAPVAPPGSATRANTMTSLNVLTEEGRDSLFKKLKSYATNADAVPSPVANSASPGNVFLSEASSSQSFVEMSEAPGETTQTRELSVTQQKIADDKFKKIENQDIRDVPQIKVKKPSRNVMSCLFACFPKQGKARVMPQPEITPDKYVPN